MKKTIKDLDKIQKIIDMMWIIAIEPLRLRNPKLYNKYCKKYEKIRKIYESRRISNTNKQD